MQYEISNTDWTQISRAGKNITARIDEQYDGAKGGCDIRVYCSVEKPALTNEMLSQAKKLYRPNGNTDCMFLSPQGELYSWWARSAKDGDVANIIAVEDGINHPVKIDVVIQDQHSQVVDRFVTRKLNTATLAIPAIKDARTLTLAAGHNFVSGNMIEIDDGTKSYQSRVINVATNVLTVTNPIVCGFAVTSNVYRVSPDLNVNGSVAPVTFTCKPPANVKWDINILSINMLDDTPMDDGTFGGIPAITNGTIFRTVDGDIEHIFTAIDNGCFRRHCDTDDPYSDKAPSGIYGLNVKRYFNSQNGDGVSRRIGIGGSGEFQVIVQDNLTALSRFWVVLRGHIVED